MSSSSRDQALNPDVRRVFIARGVGGHLNRSPVWDARPEAVGVCRSGDRPAPRPFQAGGTGAGRGHRLPLGAAPRTFSATLTAAPASAPSPTRGGAQLPRRAPGSGPARAPALLAPPRQPPAHRLGRVALQRAAAASAARHPRRDLRALGASPRRRHPRQQRQLRVQRLQRRGLRGLPLPGLR